MEVTAPRIPPGCGPFQVVDLQPPAAHVVEAADLVINFFTEARYKYSITGSFAAWVFGREQSDPVRQVDLFVDANPTRLREGLMRHGRVLECKDQEPDYLIARVRTGTHNYASTRCENGDVQVNICYTLPVMIWKMQPGLLEMREAPFHAGKLYSVFKLLALFAYTLFECKDFGRISDFENIACYFQHHYDQTRIGVATNYDVACLLRHVTYSTREPIWRRMQRMLNQIENDGWFAQLDPIYDGFDPVDPMVMTRLLEPTIT